MLTGKWTYRSYLNNPELVGGDAATALALIFGEGVFDFGPVADNAFSGTLDMGPGYAMTLSGVTVPGEPLSFAIIGLGIDGTATAGWRYDYHGSSGYSWPDGVDQVPSLTGTVVRVNAHGPHSPAGVTASFIAVGQGAAPAS